MGKEITTVKQLSTFFDLLLPQIKKALPAHLSGDRMTRLALTAFSNSKKLQECSMESIASSLMTAAQLGLEPGVNGAGFLVPYKGTCTFVPGWKGLVDLVSRSGKGTVYTGVIYKDQDFTFFDGSRRELIVSNTTDLIDEADITHAYAVGWINGVAVPVIELWSVKKLIAHRNRHNKVGGSHYSYKNLEMYFRKLVLLQVIKYMPTSIELANALDINNASEQGVGVTIEDGVVVGQSKPAEAQKNQGGRSSLPGISNDDFQEVLKNYTPLVTKGKKTVDELIAMAESKWALTDEQKTMIVGLNDVLTAAMVESKINNAKDVDALDLAADLIAEIESEKEREALMSLYKTKKDEMS